MCDWLLESRTEIWEAEKNSIEHDGYLPVSINELTYFQNDLNSLRIITQNLEVRSMFLLTFQLPNIILFNSKFFV